MKIVTALGLVGAMCSLSRPRLQVVRRRRRRCVDGVEGGLAGTSATATARIEMPAGRTWEPTRAAAANGARGRTLSGSPIGKSAAHPNCDRAARPPKDAAEQRVTV